MATMKLYIDGAARGNPGQSGIGVLLLDDQGETVAELSRYLGDHFTNNRAEYTALLHGLDVALKHTKSVEVYSDSQLLVEQMNGNYKVKHPDLLELHTQAQEKIKKFKLVRFQHIPREKNKIADELANQAIDNQNDARESA